MYLSLLSGNAVIEDSTIERNNAYISGGIHFERIVPQLLHTSIRDNSADLYGKNSFSYPNRIEVIDLIFSDSNVKSELGSIANDAPTQLLVSNI